MCIRDSVWPSLIFLPAFRGSLGSWEHHFFNKLPIPSAWGVRDVRHSPDTAWRALASPVGLSPSFTHPDWVIATFPNAGDALRMPAMFCLQVIATGLWAEHSWRMPALDALMHPENKLVPNSDKGELQLQALYVFLALSGSSSGCCLQDPPNTLPGFLSTVGGRKAKWLFSQQSLD